MKPDWPKVTFDEGPVEIIDGDRGKNYPKRDEFFHSGHCLFLNTGNVTRMGFDFTNCQFISERKDNLLRKGKLDREDIVMTTRGTIGNVGYFNKNVEYEHIRINSGMVIFRANEEELLPSFLFQYIRSSYFNKQVNSLRSGSAQPQLPIRDIKKIEIPLPDLSSQNTIAGILSKYDNLIQNNKQRIDLLEKSSRLLYKEWFVQLRFPGYEHTKIVDGVPAGWDRVKVGDYSPLNYGKSLRKDKRKEGPFHVYGSSGVIGSHNEFLVEGPCIIVGRKGNVGSVYWSPKNCYPIDTVYYVEHERSSLFLYYALQNVNFINTDVAVPGLNRDLAHSRKILIPSDILFEEFESTVNKFHKQMDILRKANNLLMRARNLLLPKLMNGDIPV
ncbi:MAG: restriction endonuclease subunit S [Balneolaceae bacterium]